YTNPLRTFVFVWDLNQEHSVVFCARIFNGSLTLQCPSHQRFNRNVNSKTKILLFLYVSRIERTSTKPSNKHPFWVLFIIPYLYPFLYVFLVYLNAQIRL